MCQMMKSDNRAKVGLLQPLKIPSRKWAHVTTDLVTNLPESNGFTAIIVFVDKLTKIVHLAGYKKEVTAMEYAQTFVDDVFRLHGLPKVIISDRDRHFTTSSSMLCSTCSERVVHHGVVEDSAMTWPTRQFIMFILRWFGDSSQFRML